MNILVDATHLAISLGAVTLACWIAAGISAVFGTEKNIRQAEAGRISEFVTTGLAAAGMTSALAMIAVLVLM
jgi:F0F1-type ATP synthase membrane subunit c/vacuolar-type H+-ATPase subunit K